MRNCLGQVEVTGITGASAAAKDVISGGALHQTTGGMSIMRSRCLVLIARIGQVVVRRAGIAIATVVSDIGQTVAARGFIRRETVAIATGRHTGVVLETVGAARDLMHVAVTTDGIHGVVPAQLGNQLG